MIVELEGLITRVHGRDAFTCTIHSGKNRSEFISREFIPPGSSVRACCQSAEKFGKDVLVAEKIERLPDMYDEVEQKAMENTDVLPSGLLDGPLGPLKAGLEQVARKLSAAQQLGRFCIVKFHGDADGISSALCLRKVFKATYMQQNSAVYGVADALRDLERMGQQFRPLLVLVDFGGGSDSAEGLALAKSGGIELVSIDHHPPGGSFSLSANPWNTGIEDGSAYPAGVLCAAIANMLGAESAGLERIACAGDKSSFLPIGQEDKDKALVLDFVATYAGFGSGLEFYSEVLEKGEIFHSVLLQARAKIEELDFLLERNVKVRETKRAAVHLVNLDALCEKREFPTKGKVASRLFEKIRDGPACVVLGYGRRSILFRLNEKAVGNGVKANEIIGIMRERFSDFVENGGGHARAAALRIREGFENAAIEEIVKLIEG